MLQFLHSVILDEIRLFNGPNLELSMLKILFTGPESTGKSYLAQNMAEHFGTLWVPEYARLYLNQLQRPYRQEDLLKIAKGQLQLEEDMAAQFPPLLFCDTSLLVIKIWSLVKYGTCHPWIEHQLTTHHYDLYCLCGIDLPWTFDPLREHPQLEDREALYQMYLKELKSLNRPYLEVNGSKEGRSQNCVKAIQRLLDTNQK